MLSEDPNIVFIGDDDYVGEEGGLGRELFDKLKQHGNAIAQICDLTGEEDSYSAFFQRSLRTAIKMRDFGVKPGDIISIIDSNHLNTSVPLVASLFLGCVVSASDPKLRQEEIVYMARQVNAKLIFTSPQFEENITKAVKQAQVATRVVVFGESKFENVEFKEFLVKPNKTEEETSFRPVKIQNLRDSLAVIIFSSGSTGLPKGICLNHFMISRTLVDIRKIYFRGHVILHFGAISWVTKLTAVLMCIKYGCILVVVPEFDKKTAWSVIVRRRVESTLLSPNQSMELLNSDVPEQTCLTAFKHMWLGGNKVSEQLLVELKKKLPHVVVGQGWGMTEVPGVSLCFSSLDFEKLPVTTLNRSLGKPVKGVRYKIVDIETGKILGPNRSGELRLKSKIVMSGYFMKDSSNAWDEEGYLKTGDLMYYDEDFCFYYVDRIGEMFKCRSDYVFPYLIEDVLLTHPNVMKAVVVGVSHPKDGKRPAAMVTLKAPLNDTTSDELIKHVKDDGRCFPLIGGVKIVEKIPEYSSGKVNRKCVKDMLTNE